MIGRLNRVVLCQRHNSQRPFLLAFAGPLSLLLCLVVLAVTMGPRYQSAGWQPIVNKWRPQIEVFNRIEELTTDTAGTSTNWTFVGGPAPLALTTSYAGDDKILHPDWVYIPEGFGGHRWWMVASPFPKDTAPDPVPYENPEIFHSDDGLTWTAIAGNPIDAYPGAGNGNADPSLLYENGVLYCYYAEWNVAVGHIRYRSSTNGLTWSSEGTVLADLALYAGAVPIVRNVRGTYYLWVTDLDAAPDVLRVRTGPSPVGPWSTPTTCTLTGAASTPWHVNLTVIGDKIVLIGTIGATRVGQIGVSSDGVTFLFDKNLAYTGPSAAWDDAATYQFGQPIWNPEGQFFDVVYGGLDTDDADDDFKIGRGRIYCNRSGIYPIKRAAMNRILATLGDCRGLWPMQQVSGTTAAVLDASLYSHHMTGSTDIGTWATPPAWTGLFHALTFNGTSDGASLADDADFTMIDGSGNDIAFSVGAWVYVANTAAEREILGKYASTSNKEWRLTLDSNEKPYLATYDHSATATEIRTADAALTPLSAWHFVVATRDATQGDGCASGFKIYVDGVVVASTATGAGTYVDMENLAASLTLGYVDVAGSAYGWFDGKMATPFITAKELTAAEVWSLYQDSKVMLSQ